MSSEGEEGLAIRQADYLRPAFLSIAGTVLVCREKWWTGDITWYVPVEWVTIAPGGRRDQRWLAGSLFIFIGFLVGSFALGETFPHSEDLKRVSVVLLLLAFLSLPVTLFLWMRRRPTIILEAEPAKARWEFFKDPAPDGPQRLFLEDLQALQARIRDIEPFPAKSSFARRAGRRWRELVTLTALFMVPALITERVNLLPLALLPLGWELVRNLRFLLQPQRFRRAVRSARKGRYEEVIEAQYAWVGANPPHKPSLELLFECCVENGRYEEALEATRRMRDLDPERAREMEEDAWLFRRIRERMQNRT